MSRRRRARARRQPTPPVASGPVLVSATFDNAGPYVVTLTFDRAVDVAGLVPDDVVVYDGPGVTEWRGTAAYEQPTPESLSVTLVENGEFLGAAVSLTAAGGAGVVAADDPEATWAGVTDLDLPFP